MSAMPLANLQMSSWPVRCAASLGPRPNAFTVGVGKHCTTGSIIYIQLIHSSLFLSSPDLWCVNVENHPQIANTSLSLFIGPRLGFAALFCAKIGPPNVCMALLCVKSWLPPVFHIKHSWLKSSQCSLASINLSLTPLIQLNSSKSEKLWRPGPDQLVFHRRRLLRLWQTHLKPMVSLGKGTVGFPHWWHWYYRRVVIVSSRDEKWRKFKPSTRDEQRAGPVALSCGTPDQFSLHQLPLGCLNILD